MGMHFGHDLRYAATPPLPQNRDRLSFGSISSALGGRSSRMMARLAEWLAGYISIIGTILPAELGLELHFLSYVSYRRIPGSRLLL